MQITSTFCICVLGLSILLVGQLQPVSGGATEEQMWATGKMIRDICQPKFPKITKEIGDNIKAGKLADDKDQKCYVNCILEMMQTIKKGKFLIESSMKQVEVILPDKYKDDYRNGIAVCKDAANGIKNNCDAAAALYRCLTENIKVFVFP